MRSTPRRSVLRLPLPVNVFILAAALAACSSEGRGGYDPAAAADGTQGTGGTSSSSSGGFDVGDGGTPAQACVPNRENYDIPGNGCDDDGDGKVDNPETCDGALPESGSAEEFARAIGLCATVAKNGWGLVSAKFTRGYGMTEAPAAEQHGVLRKFGDLIKPREGASLGVLSSGYAREFNGAPNAPFGGSKGFPPQPVGKDWYGFGPGGPGKTSNGKVPPGFPKPADGCPVSEITNDVIDLKLEIKAPRNAAGIAFDFNFYSGEWPHFLCSNFNDGFLAFLTSKAFNGGKGDNISFDKANNPVSVNNGFFDRCQSGVTVGCGGAKSSTSTCPGGPGELAGTGFGVRGAGCQPGAQVPLGGATGWLTSKAPVQAGETFTLELLIWDTGDAVLDSSVLIDNFRWAEGKVTTETERPK